MGTNSPGSSACLEASGWKTPKVRQLRIVHGTSGPRLVARRSVPASKVRVYLGKDFTGTGEPSNFQDVDPFSATLPGGVFVG